MCVVVLCLQFRGKPSTFATKLETFYNLIQISLLQLLGVAEVEKGKVGVSWDLKQRYTKCMFTPDPILSLGGDASRLPCYWFTEIYASNACKSGEGGGLATFICVLVTTIFTYTI